MPLGLNVLTSGYLSPHQLASSIVHLASMRAWFPNIDQDQLKLVSRAVSYHYFYKSLGYNIAPKTMLEKPKLSNMDIFFLHYTLVIGGHYMDHCRGSWSNMLEQKFFHTFFRQLGDTDSAGANNLAKMVAEWTAKTQVNQVDTSPDYSKTTSKVLEQTCRDINTCGQNGFNSSCKVAKNLQYEPKLDNGNDYTKRTQFEKLWLYLKLDKDINDVFTEAFKFL